MTRVFRLVAIAIAIAVTVSVNVEISAQVLDQDHGQYSRADIEAGQRLYGPQCQVCHGANGDGVPGIDLKLGRFRRSSSDEDLARVITSGVPGTGMPAFVLRPEELTAVDRVHPRRLRSGLRRRARRRCDAGPRAIRRPRRMRDVSPRQRPRPPPRSRLERHRRDPHARGAAARAADAERIVAADSPPRPHRDERRPHAARSTSKRRHLFGANH